MNTTRTITPAVRGLALALGLLLAFGAASRGLAGFDFTIWLLDTRALPSFVGAVLVAMGAVVLTAWAIRPMQGSVGRGVTAAIIGVLALVATANATVFWWLAAHGVIRAGVFVPLSALFAAAFGAIAWQAATRRIEAAGTKGVLRLAGTAIACLVAFPVLQVEWFGRTHYARASDWAVVPGARVYADGTLCASLEDRVQSAVALHRAGVVRVLVMSGGAGPGGMHETEAMRLRAIALGVPAADILVDRDGVNTAATAANVVRMARESGVAPRLTVVSEFYHLPRLKMSFARAGLDVRTEPATPGHWLGQWQLPNIAREVPAFWFYALRPARAFETRG